MAGTAPESDFELQERRRLAAAVRRRAWLWRLLAWDGLGPPLVALAAMSVQRCFPGNSLVVEVSACAASTLSILIRAPLARWQALAAAGAEELSIDRERALTAALAFLMTFEILSVLVGPGGAQGDGWIVCAGLYMFYLPCMAYALRPG